MTARILNAHVEVNDYEDVRYHMQNCVARALRLAAFVEAAATEAWISQAHVPCAWIPSCLVRTHRCHVEADAQLSR
jgi:hypothetical protein